MKVSEERLNKLLNAFGHNCDYLHEEAYSSMIKLLIEELINWIKENIKSIFNDNE